MMLQKMTAMLPASLLAAVVALAAGGVAAQGVEFKHPLDNSPVEIPLPEGDERTEAVAQFHETGENMYEGDADVLAEGKEIYQRWCQSCHMPDGSGRMGPSLIDETFNYPRTDTALGMFEVVHEGATGAMQAFGTRLTQDEILKVIAYVDSLGQ